MNYSVVVKNLFPVYVQTLTNKLNKFNHEKRPQTLQDIEDLLWDDIELLMNDPNKELILKKWKYGNSFKITEKNHENDSIGFSSKLSSKQSFILGFLAKEFH
jgi:hypothetical protein